jgi:geranylgeranyl reductase family protein
MEHFDIAIVGAGPAGCWAATRLAQRGARVALIDGSHPREKPCGGGVTGRALDLVREAIAPARVSHVAIESATFQHKGRSARMPIAVPPAGPLLAVMPRRTFDGALLAAARDSGVRFVAARARNVERSGTGWIAATLTGSIEADWLLGADGPNSLVRRRVHKPFDRADLSIATGYYVHGTTSRDITIAFEDDPPGYLWSFPRPDHLAVGVCGQADVASAAALQSIAARWIRDYAAGSVDRLERYSWPIPSLSSAALQREPPSGRRWLLLGDAGGMVDPITREGIFFALDSGDAAAESLAGNGNVERRYEQRVRETIHAELRRAATLKERFFRPQFTGLLVTAIQRSGRIRDVMADLISGQQPYRGLRRRLLATCEIGLLVDWLRG